MKDRPCLQTRLGQDLHVRLLLVNESPLERVVTTNLRVHSASYTGTSGPKLKADARTIALASGDRPLLPSKDPAPTPITAFSSLEERRSW